MDRSTAEIVCTRLAACITSSGTEQTDTVLRLPVDHYLDPERWQREVDGIFKRVPLIMVTSGQVREPGDYVAREVCGLPLIVMRGADGVVRTFLNACRHRGAAVCELGTGSAKRLTCPYHAWVYDTTGALVGLQARQSFGEVDTEGLGLTRLPTEERHGLVWAVLDPAGSIDVDGWVGDMAGPLDDLRLGEMWEIAASTLEGPNWKVAKDGYFDGYHFGSLHKNTLGLIYRSNTQAFDFHGVHQRFYFASHTLAGLADDPDAIAAHDDPAELFGTVTSVFPNTAFAGGGDSLLMSQVFPGPGPQDSITFQTHLRREPVRSEADRESAMKRVAFLEYVVTEEDYRTGRSIGRALPSGANTEFLFGRNEWGNQHFHRSVERMLAEASADPGAR